MDAKDFMEKLLEEDIPLFTDWKMKCQKIAKLLENTDKETGNMVIEKISSLLPKDPVVAIDVGQNQCWSAQSLHLKGEKGRILIGGGYGSMGCGLPYAIGASIANKNSVVYCITGDGGLQMNIQELESVVSEKLPIKILVLNNYALGKISEIQSGSYGGRFAQTTSQSGYSVPDFVKLAEAYGIKSVNVEDFSELDNYKDWLYDSKPCLINIKLPEDTLLIPKIKWETGKILPELDSKLASQIDSILD